MDPVGDLGVGFDKLGLEIRETFEEAVFDFGELLGDVHGGVLLCFDVRSDGGCRTGRLSVHLAMQTIPSIAVKCKRVVNIC